MHQESLLLAARYQHDCSRCLYLGQFEEYDLYYCEQVIGGQTVLARYGNEGSEYLSGIHSTLEPLQEAQIRALDLFLNNY